MSALGQIKQASAETKAVQLEMSDSAGLIAALVAEEKTADLVVAFERTVQRFTDADVVREGTTLWIIGRSEYFTEEAIEETAKKSHISKEVAATLSAGLLCQFAVDAFKHFTITKVKLVTAYHSETPAVVTGTRKQMKDFCNETAPRQAWLSNKRQLTRFVSKDQLPSAGRTAALRRFRTVDSIKEGRTMWIISHGTPEDIEYLVRMLKADERFIDLNEHELTRIATTFGTASLCMWALVQSEYFTFKLVGPYTRETVVVVTGTRDEMKFLCHQTGPRDIIENRLYRLNTPQNPDIASTEPLSPFVEFVPKDQIPKASL